MLHRGMFREDYINDKPPAIIHVKCKILHMYTGEAYERGTPVVEEPRCAGLQRNTCNSSCKKY